MVDGARLAPAGEEIGVVGHGQHTRARLLPVALQAGERWACVEASSMVVISSQIT